MDDRPSVHPISLPQNQIASLGSKGLEQAWDVVTIDRARSCLNSGRLRSQASFPEEFTRRFRNVVSIVPDAPDLAKASLYFFLPLRGRSRTSAPAIRSTRTRFCRRVFTHVSSPFDPLRRCCRVPEPSRFISPDASDTPGISLSATTRAGPSSEFF